MKIRNRRLGDVNLPDFLVVGAAKSATSSIHHYLDQHPEIKMPEIKEPWFFSFLNNPPSYTSPGKLNDVVSVLDDYVKLFENASPEQKIGEASPSYLYTYRDSINNIQSIYPAEDFAKLKIIISLRDPVRRALSQYWTFTRKAQEPLTFEEAIKINVISQRLKSNWNIFYDYIGFGHYYEQVKAYLDTFGEDRVLILLYDDIQDDAVNVCRTIYKFIGVDPDFRPDLERQHNSLSGETSLMWLPRILKSTNPVKRILASCIPENIRKSILRSLGKRFLKRPDMPNELRLRLMNLYSDDIARLEKLIHRDLGNWKNDV
jgi:hypothetical protein